MKCNNKNKKKLLKMKNNSIILKIKMKKKIINHIQIQWNMKIQIKMNKMKNILMKMI